MTKNIVKAIESKKTSRISLKVVDSFGKNLLPMSNSVEASYSEIDEESPIGHAPEAKKLSFKMNDQDYKPVDIDR